MKSHLSRPADDFREHELCVSWSRYLRFSVRMPTIIMGHFDENGELREGKTSRSVTQQV
jgi:hypothetical protein